MLITESFVLLNCPKTGSSFSRKVIKDLYADQPRRWFGRRYCIELTMPNIRHEGQPDQHGTYSQIPRRYRNREVVSILRDPYEKFLSGFEFRYWAFNPLLPAEILGERFPAFPELTLDAYIDFLQLVHAEPVGPQAFQFMQIFSREFPKPMFAAPDLRSVLKGLANITFLRQENLNWDLTAFLHRKGFSKEQTAFIETHEPVNVTVGKSANRNLLWTPKALNYVRESESLLFQILEEQGIYYDQPRSVAA